VFVLLGVDHFGRPLIGDNAEALRIFQALCQKHPESIIAWNNLGAVQLLSGMDCSEALERAQALAAKSKNTDKLKGIPALTMQAVQLFLRRM